MFFYLDFKSNRSLKINNYLQLIVREIEDRFSKFKLDTKIEASAYNLT